jgi:hypothetical protein
VPGNVLKKLTRKCRIDWCSIFSKSHTDISRFHSVSTSSEGLSFVKTCIFSERSGGAVLPSGRCASSRTDGETKSLTVDPDTKLFQHAKPEGLALAQYLVENPIIARLQDSEFASNIFPPLRPPSHHRTLYVCLGRPNYA